MKVYLIHSAFDNYFLTMFKKNNFKVVNKVIDADIIQFAGGEDVDPSLYNEPKEKYTYSSLERDMEEKKVYDKYVGKKIMLGVCRGGQFLNVMNGGKLHQHVEGHCQDHLLKLLPTNKIYRVTSTHHQVMIPSKEGEVIGTDLNGSIEIVFYKKTNSFCFQPHPEFLDYDDSTEKLYFNLLTKLFSNVGEN